MEKGVIDYEIKKVVYKTLRRISKKDIPVKEKCRILGRSTSWYYTKMKQFEQGVRKTLGSKEKFFDWVDTIPNKSARVIRGYAKSTVKAYMSEYSNLIEQKIKYRITETRSGISVYIREL